MNQFVLFAYLQDLSVWGLALQLSLNDVLEATFDGSEMILAHVFVTYVSDGFHFILFPGSGTASSIAFESLLKNQVRNVTSDTVNC